MPKMSYEGLVGTVMTLIIVVLEQAGVRNPYVLWGAFALAWGVCVDAVIRSAWTKRRKTWASITILILYGLFGIYLIRQLRPVQTIAGTSRQIDTAHESPSQPQQSPPPVSTTTAPAPVKQPKKTKHKSNAPQQDISAHLEAGKGGDATGNGNGGAGGSISITAGSGGNASDSGNSGAGGDVVIGPKISQQSPPQTQTCAPGAYCAQSTGQSGGITGQVFVDTHPRISITDNQQAAITEAMKPFGGHKATIIVNGNTQEIAEFGKRLNSALLDAKLLPNIGAGFAGHEDGTIMLPCEVQYGDNDANAGKALMHALIDNHVLSGKETGFHYYNGQPGTLIITISPPS
jgi:hypothetical protein